MTHTDDTYPVLLTHRQHRIAREILARKPLADIFFDLDITEEEFRSDIAYLQREICPTLQ